MSKPNKYQDQLSHAVETTRHELLTQLKEAQAARNTALIARDHAARDKWSAYKQMGDNEEVLAVASRIEDLAARTQLLGRNLTLFANDSQTGSEEVQVAMSAAATAVKSAVEAMELLTMEVHGVAAVTNTQNKGNAVEKEALAANEAVKLAVEAGNDLQRHSIKCSIVAATPLAGSVAQAFSVLGDQITDLLTGTTQARDAARQEVAATTTNRSVTWKRFYTTIPPFERPLQDQQSLLTSVQEIDQLANYNLTVRAANQVPPDDRKDAAVDQAGLAAGLHAEVTLPTEGGELYDDPVFYAVEKSESSTFKASPGDHGVPGKLKTAADTARSAADAALASSNQATLAAAATLDAAKCASQHTHDLAAEIANAFTEAGKMTKPDAGGHEKSQTDEARTKLESAEEVLKTAKTKASDQAASVKAAQAKVDELEAAVAKARAKLAEAASATPSQGDGSPTDAAKAAEDELAKTAKSLEEAQKETEKQTNEFSKAESAVADASTKEMAAQAAFAEAEKAEATQSAEKSSVRAGKIAEAAALAAAMAKIAAAAADIDKAAHNALTTTTKIAGLTVTSADKAEDAAKEAAKAGSAAKEAAAANAAADLVAKELHRAEGIAKAMEQAAKVTVQAASGLHGNSSEKTANVINLVKALAEAAKGVAQATRDTAAAATRGAQETREAAAAARLAATPGAGLVCTAALQTDKSKKNLVFGKTYCVFMAQTLKPQPLPAPGQKTLSSRASLPSQPVLATYSSQKLSAPKILRFQCGTLPGPCDPLLVAFTLPKQPPAGVNYRMIMVPSKLWEKQQADEQFLIERASPASYAELVFKPLPHNDTGLSDIDLIVGQISERFLNDLHLLNPSLSSQAQLDMQNAARADILAMLKEPGMADLSRTALVYYSPEDGPPPAHAKEKEKKKPHVFTFGYYSDMSGDIINLANDCYTVGVLAVPHASTTNVSALAGESEPVGAATPYYYGSGPVAPPATAATAATAAPQTAPTA